MRARMLRAPFDESGERIEAQQMGEDDLQVELGTLCSRQVELEVYADEADVAYRALDRRLSKEDIRLEV